MNRFQRQSQTKRKMLEKRAQNTVLLGGNSLSKKKRKHIFETEAQLKKREEGRLVPAKQKNKIKKERNKGRIPGFCCEVEKGKA